MAYKHFFSIKVRSFFYKGETNFFFHLYRTRAGWYNFELCNTYNVWLGFVFRPTPWSVEHIKSEYGRKLTIGFGRGKLLFRAHAVE
jgi:hypothetical protein